MIQQNTAEHDVTSMEAGEWRQFMAAIIINLSAITCGVMAGWASPTIPQLVKENPPVGEEPMIEDEISWLTSVISITALLSLPSCAWSSEKFGLTFSTVPVYVAEISAETIRGQLGCYFGFGINIGILMAFIVGAILSYRHFAIFGLVFPVGFFSTFIFMPETPTYLIRKGRIVEAPRSLMWLRSNDQPKVDHELYRLQQQLAEMSKTESAKLKDLFRDRGIIKGFIISSCLLIGQETSEFSTVFSYTATIFELTNSSLSPNNASIVLGAIQIMGSVLSTLIIDRSGRRPLLLVSCAVMIMCHLVFGIFFLLQNQSYDSSSFTWLPIVPLPSYALACSIELGPAAYVVTAEIFSPEIASLGTLVSMIPVFLASFATLKLFPFVTSILGSHIVFFILASFRAYTFLITYFLLPETKGKSRQSIFEELNSRSNEKTDIKKVSA